MWGERGASTHQVPPPVTGPPPFHRRGGAHVPTLLRQQGYDGCMAAGPSADGAARGRAPTLDKGSQANGQTRPWEAGAPWRRDRLTQCSHGAEGTGPAQRVAPGARRVRGVVPYRADPVGCAVAREERAMD